MHVSIATPCDARSIPYPPHASGFTSYPIKHMERHESAWLPLALRGLSCPSIEVIKEEACDRSGGTALLGCRSMQILSQPKCLCVRDAWFENHLRGSRLHTATWGVVVRGAHICIQMTGRPYCGAAKLLLFLATLTNRCKCAMRGNIFCLDSQMRTPRRNAPFGFFYAPPPNG